MKRMRLHRSPLATVLAASVAVAGLTVPAANAWTIPDEIADLAPDPISTSDITGIGAPIPGLEPDPDSGELSTQTQVVGGLWDTLRPLISHQNVNDDPAFYTAPEGTDLQNTAPGTVLRERTIDYHVATIPTPVKVTQILYTTTNVLGNIEPNVTSVIHPPGGSDGNVISYQSIYDSSNPADNPSRAIAGNLELGTATRSSSPTPRARTPTSPPVPPTATPPSTRCGWPAPRSPHRSRNPTTSDCWATPAAPSPRTGRR